MSIPSGQFFKSLRIDASRVGVGRLVHPGQEAGKAQGSVCERVKGGFPASFHTGALIVSGLSGCDGSERSLCEYMDLPKAST